MSYSNFSNKSRFTKIVARFYTVWVVFWFVFIFICLFPLYYITLQKDTWKPYAHNLNRIWGKILMVFIAMKIRVEYQFIPDKKGTYVFVSNHFSYWDIATMGLIIDNYYAFVGKSSVKKIPLIGYMFSKLHIQVDRSEKESRAKSMSRAMKALEKGRSMMIFAEGGIVTRNPPHMVKPFKDGAFLMAIQNQIPIVPISLLTNHQILWDEQILIQNLPIRAVVHTPIPTLGLHTSNMDELKEQTWQIIQNELNKYYGLPGVSSPERQSKI